MFNLTKDLLEHSFKNNLSHIPSSLSMLDYVYVLFSGEFVKPYRDHIVIGKPFGAQTYYLTWKKLGYLNNINDLSVGVKHDELFFVDYGEETMGNALGVSSGIALASNSKVWVNISDATLQMGNTLEAIQFIGHNNLKNILLTIDYNNTQVTGHVNDILTVEPTKNMFSEYGWNVEIVDGHNHTKLTDCFSNLSQEKPNVVFCNTIKGHGVSLMENSLDWHYKKIQSKEELESMIDALHLT